MEDELKCPQCGDFYSNPVLLPCTHSLCYACALHLVEKFNTSNNIMNKFSKPKNTSSTTGSNSVMNTPKRQHRHFGTVSGDSSSLTAAASNSSLISANINAAIANAAKSASTLIAMSCNNNINNNTSNVTSSGSSSSSSSSSSPSPSSGAPASISPQSSISSTSSISIGNENHHHHHHHHRNRALSVTDDLGSSIISDLDKLSVFSEADSGVQTLILILIK